LFANFSSDHFTDLQINDTTFHCSAFADVLTVDCVVL